LRSGSNVESFNALKSRTHRPARRRTTAWPRADTWFVLPIFLSLRRVPACRGCDLRIDLVRVVFVRAALVFFRSPARRFRANGRAAPAHTGYHTPKCYDVCPWLYRALRPPVRFFALVFRNLASLGPSVCACAACDPEVLRHRCLRTFVQHLLLVLGCANAARAALACVS
jgi:hypothetical protein